MIFILIALFYFYFLYLLSSDKSGSLDDESGDDGSDSGSSGTYYFRTFSFCFEDSVGSFSSLGSGVFAPIGFEPEGDIFVFDVFVPIGVEYTVG